MVDRQKLVLTGDDEPDMEGLDLAGRMLLIDPDIRIVMVSGYRHSERHSPGADGRVFQQTLPAISIILSMAWLPHNMEFLP
jgi:hypothetical protein